MNIIIKRIIYCVVIFLVPTIVSFVISIVNNILSISNDYLSCINNAELEIIEIKIEEKAKLLLDEALLEDSYVSVEYSLEYINRIKDENKKNELREMANNAKNAIAQEIKANVEEEESIRFVTANKNSKYYFDNMESPDSQDDYTVLVKPDPNYVSRAVKVTDEEKAMIISTISNEMGSCKAGAVSTAQTIRDIYLYLSGFDNTGNTSTITGVIKSAFSPSYVYNLKTSENGEWAYNYVFVEGNSFYPRKFVGQRGFDTNGAEKNLGYYEILKLKTHYDDPKTGTKRYITDPTRATGYNLGNSNLDTGGNLADYVNPNAVLK